MGSQNKPKNSKLPEGDWNRYGGTVEYTASNAVFPQGLAAFHQSAGLPFITHNRWIDPASPYHQRYKISGIAAVDPGFWKEIATYLKSSGVVAYEQDWLSAIFPHSPELTSTPDLGDAFLDGMANAMRDQGLSVQYCMALPRCFLQGSKYGNLTTIRTSDDRLKPSRYHDFLYTSRFASALGMWPWSDVFMSGETNNLLVSNLSAGPVGTGDEIGKENRANILKAIRADGVIIKPDTAVVPVDSAYIAEAQKQTVPLVCTAQTDHRGHKTVYALAVGTSKTPGAPFTLGPADLGTSGPACVYDYFAANAQWLEKNQPYRAHSSRWLELPHRRTGRGERHRVSGRFREVRFDGAAKDFVGGRPILLLTIQVLLSTEESSVTLHGYCRQKPAAAIQHGVAEPVVYDASTGHFSVVIHPDQSVMAGPGLDPVRQIDVVLERKSS